MLQINYPPQLFPILKWKKETEQKIKQNKYQNQLENDLKNHLLYQAKENPEKIEQFVNKLDIKG